MAPVDREVNRATLIARCDRLPYLRTSLADGVPA
jgi:hypothetical protein